MKEPIFSHPGVPLERHLLEVAREARRLLDHPALRARERLRELAFLAGITHDFGKLTTYFQRHLRGERVPRGLHQHSLISALFAAYVARQRFPEDPVAALILYLAVHRHHGALYAPDRIWISRDQENILKRQWTDLTNRKEKVREVLRRVWPEGDLGFLNHSFSDVLQDISRWLKKGYRKVERTIPLCEEWEADGEVIYGVTALHVQLVFSALISADKLTAASVSRPNRLRLTPEVVDRYVQELQRRSSPLSALRTHLQENVRQSLKKSPLPGVFTLTAPTGSGKTLAAFRAALQAREELHRRWGIPPRVIYALPFINLIEQVEDTLRDVLRRHPQYETMPERFLVAHHHLADIRYRDEGERPLHEALLLVEGWESEVVVTTFVQVFHTVFGYENRFLKKLHNLVGAVLILDEPQQFPVEYWKALGWMADLLHREMGVTLVQMTATQPRMLDDVPHKELVSSEVRHAFAEVLSRYTVYHLPDEQSFEDTLFREVGSGRRVLVVVNTIRTSLELWDRFRNLGEHRFYLSTNILPLHRRERIQRIRDRLRQEGPLLVVSTQVIEAGVDLDFDVVFREMSPLDALIQAAGRCNREGRLSKKGRVYQFVLEHSRIRGNQVYGAVAMDASRAVWSGKKALGEQELLELLPTYYAQVLERGTTQPSRCLWEKYARLLFFDPRGFTESLRDYPLIAHRGEVPVLVMVSEEDMDRLERFRQEVLEQKGDVRARHEAFLKHRLWLHERTLRVLETRIRQNLPPEWEGTGFRWIPYDQLETYYDWDTGYRWRKEDLEDEVWVL